MPVAHSFYLSLTPHSLAFPLYLSFPPISRSLALSFPSFPFHLYSFPFPFCCPLLCFAPHNFAPCLFKSAVLFLFSDYSISNDILSILLPSFLCSVAIFSPFLHLPLLYTFPPIVHPLVFSVVYQPELFCNILSCPLSHFLLYFATRHLLVLTLFQLAACPPSLASSFDISAIAVLFIISCFLHFVVHIYLFFSLPSYIILQ